MEKLVTDITYLYFENCRLYLSSIMDLYNREIVAYTISECQDTDFVLDTLNQLELPQGALFHSDQGSVYTSKAYYQACTEKGITRSLCPEKEHQQIMPVSNGSILFSSLKPSISISGET